MKIAVLGSGSWGITLAWLFAKSADQIMLWGRNEAVISKLHNERCITSPVNIVLPPSVEPSFHLQETIKDADIILLVVPTTAVREISQKLATLNLSPKTILVNTSKGLEIPTLKRMSQIIQEELPQSPIAVLSGPTLAHEVIKGEPTAASIACEDLTIASHLQKTLSIENRFRLYSNSDVLGVELGGALKNVIAIAVGFISKLGYGDNCKATLITRGIAEMAKVYNIFGAKITTLYGLSGIGDLIATSNSTFSRNYQVGYKLAEQKTLDVILQEIGTVAEGVKTTYALCQLEEQLNIELPIAQEIKKALENIIPPQDIVNRLMNRSLKTEDIDYKVKRS